MRGLTLLRSLLATASLLASQTTYTIDTVAGSSWNGDGGPAIDALLRQPQGIAKDKDENIYIAEAGAHRVRKVSRSGTIATIAGTGIRGFSGDGGPAAAAQLNTPYGLAIDPIGNLYIADLGNSRVRRVSTDGTITTIAGGGVLAPTVDNQGRQATEYALLTPRNIAIAYNGDIYVSDFDAHRVFRVYPTGELTLFAGTGEAGFFGDGGSATLAKLAYPAGILADYTSLYIADSQNGVVRRVADGKITSVLQVPTPVAIGLDAWGVLHVADAATGNLIRFAPSSEPVVVIQGASDLTLGIDSALWVSDANAGVVRTLSYLGEAGLGAGNGSSVRGDAGPAIEALLQQPSGVAVDTLGNLYIADRANNRIRRVTPEGVIDTLAGRDGAASPEEEPGFGDGGPALEARLRAPSAIAVDAMGDLFVSDTGHHRVREITPAGVVLPIAGTGVPGVGGEGEVATESALTSPGGLALDPAGNLYIADTGNGRIRRISSSGIANTLLGDLHGPRGLTFEPGGDGAGQLYFTEEDAARVGRIDLVSGQITYFGMDSDGNSLWSVPRGIAVDASGDVFVADTGRQQILRIAAGSTAPEDISVMAGTGSAGFSGDQGPALDAQLGYPWDVAVGLDDRIYVADLDNGRVRRMAPAPDDPPPGIVVLNAASFASSPVAPGMLIALRNTGVKETDAGDLTVLINAILTPVISVDDTQIVTEAPMTLSSADSVDIVLVNQGALIASLSVNAAAAAPALFTDGSGHALAANQDGTMNTNTNPAASGSVVTLLGTGFGLGDLPLSVTLNGVAAAVVSSGAVSASPGMFQLNARVPAGLPAGFVDVLVSAGGFSSPPGVRLAVQ